MRIALYHNLTSGGAKRTLSEAAKRLAQLYHVEVYSLTSANHRFADLRPHAAGYHVFDFSPFPQFGSPFGRLNQVGRIIDLLRLRIVGRKVAWKIDQGNYDVVLAHPCQLETRPSVLSYLQNVPAVYYCHEPAPVMRGDAASTLRPGSSHAADTRSCRSASRSL